MVAVSVAESSSFTVPSAAVHRSRAPPFRYTGSSDPSSRVMSIDVVRRADRGRRRGLPVVGSCTPCRGWSPNDGMLRSVTFRTLRLRAEPEGHQGPTVFGLQCRGCRHQSLTYRQLV